jgi:oligosaccharide reducing-end xylanase
LGDLNKVGISGPGAEISRTFLVRTTSPETGLVPNYANFDGTPHVTNFSQSGEFGCDAWRVASNWSVDWSWWRKAAADQQLGDRMQRFFAAEGIAEYGPVSRGRSTESAKRFQVSGSRWAVK